MNLKVTGIPLMALSIAIAINLTMSSPEVRADSFPGKGNRLDWGYSLPYYNLANKYLNKGRYDMAIEKYKEAIGRYPYDPDFFINMGLCYRMKKDYVSAEAAFKKAIELNDKDWMSWMNLGNAYLKQNKLAETRDAYEKAIALNPPQKEKEGLEQDIKDITRVMKNQASK